MNTIVSFDPIANPTGFIQTNGINKDEQVILYNSSLACLQLTFLDNTQDVLPPCWVRTYSKAGVMGNIAYSTSYTLPMEGQPVSLLYGTLYESGEHIAEVNQPIQYVQVGQYMTEQFVSNTTSAPGTVFIVAAPTGDTGSAGAVSISVDGHMILGDATYPGTITMNTASGKTITLDNTGITISSGGVAILNLDYAGNINLASGGTLNVFDAGTRFLIADDNGVGVRLGRGSTGSAIDQNATHFFLKAAANGASLAFFENGVTRWTRWAETIITGTGNGSFACPYPGSWDMASTDPCTVSGSSQTIGVSFACPSVVTTGAGLAWRVHVQKF